jgi:hypothetical protein
MKYAAERRDVWLEKRDEYARRGDHKQAERANRVAMAFDRAVRRRVLTRDEAAKAIAAKLVGRGVSPRRAAVFGTRVTSSPGPKKAVR